MKNKNRITILNFLSNFLLLGISIFSAPVFSRLLGTSGYGIVSVYGVWTGVLGILVPMRSNVTLVNARVEYPEEQQDAYQSAVLTMSLLGFLAAAVLCTLFLKPLSGALNLPGFLVYLMLLQAFGNFATSFAGSKYTYEFKAGRNFFLSVGITLASLSLSLALVLSFPQENRFLGRILGNAIVYGGTGLVLAVGILRRGRTFIRPDYWKFCVTLAAPMVFYSLSDMMLAQSDQIMLQSMLDSSSVGLYGLAYTFSNVLFTIFHSLNSSWAPFFFEDMKNGRRDNIQSSAKNFLELFTILAMGFILLAPEVFKIYARQDFWGGLNLIPLFATGYYMNFLCTFPVNYDYYRKQNKMVAFITIACAASNLGLNYIMIGQFGVVGAALATMLSHVLQMILHNLYAGCILGKEDYPYPVKLWGGYALAYMGVFALTYLLPDQWLARWGFGAVLGLWELYRIRKRGGLL